MINWLTPGDPKLSEVQQEVQQANSLMVVKVFSVILRELYATPIEDLIDVAGISEGP